MNHQHRVKLVNRLKSKTTEGGIEWRDGLLSDMFVADIENLGFVSLDTHDEHARLRVRAPTSGSVAFELDAERDTQLASELQALYAAVAGASAMETQAVERSTGRWVDGGE